MSTFTSSGASGSLIVICCARSRTPASIEFRRVPHQLAQVGRFALQGDGAAHHLGRMQQVLDQLGHVADLAVEALQRALGSRRVQLDHAQRGHRGVERLAELVRNHRQPFVFVTVVGFGELPRPLLRDHRPLTVSGQGRQLLVQFDQLPLQLLLVVVDRLAQDEAAIGIRGRPRTTG